MNHTQYLQGRIELMKDAHAYQIEMADDCMDVDRYNAHRSAAASIWDTKTELEKALTHYEQSLTEFNNQQNY